MAEKNQETVI